MSQPTFNERAKTFVDRTKALFTLDPRWHEDPVYEGDVDPRVGELLERLLSAEPIARTEDGEMVVRLDPDTLRGWLVTEVEAADAKAGPQQRNLSHEGDDVQAEDSPTPGDAEGQGAQQGGAASMQSNAADRTTRRKMTPVHSAQVRELRYRPELLERYQQTGSWDEEEG